MENTAYRASGQPTGPKAPAPPAPLAALVAGLAALIEAHQASATSGAALVLWQVLSSLHAMASRVLASPSTFTLEALAGGPLAAGLMVREEGVPAARGARIAPQLSEVHRDLICNTLELIKELDEARWHLHGLIPAIEALERARTPDDAAQWVQCASEYAEQMRDAMRLAEGTACVISRHLVGCDPDCSLATHAARLARVWTASSESRATFDLIELELAAAAFAGT